MTSHCFRLLSSLMRNNCRSFAVQHQRLIFTDVLKAELRMRGMNNCVQISTAANLRKELDDTFVSEATNVLQQIKKEKASMRFNLKQVYAHISGYNLNNYSEDYLNNLFSQFGSVQRVDINLVNAYHGYAVISFNDEESTQKALSAEKLTLDDNHVLLIKKRKETRNNKKRAFIINALPYDITVTKLKDYLSVFCDVDRIHLMIKSRKIKKEKDKTLGQNYAIVLLNSGFDTILERNHQLDDNSLIVAKMGKDFQFRQGGDEHKKLLIEGLPKKISEVDLRQYFQKYGTVRHVYVEIDRSTKIPSGLGYVHFTQSSSAQDAADILIQELNGSPVRVRLMGFQA